MTAAMSPGPVGGVARAMVTPPGQDAWGKLSRPHMGRETLKPCPREAGDTLALSFVGEKPQVAAVVTFKRTDDGQE